MDDDSDAEENETIAQAHFDRMWNHGEVDKDVLADDYHVVANIGEHAELILEKFRGKIAHFHEAFPNRRRLSRRTGRS